jgi:sialidase-1
MKAKRLLNVLLLGVVFVMPASIPAEESAIERTVLFEEETKGFRLYRIPGIVVTARGTVLAYCEARKFSVADRGEIEIHLRRSTDSGGTWDAPRQIAHAGPRLPRTPPT